MIEKRKECTNQISLTLIDYVVRVQCDATVAAPENQGWCYLQPPHRADGGQAYFCDDVVLIMRAVGCADCSPIFCGGACGTGGATDDFGLAIFPVILSAREGNALTIRHIVVVGGPML